MLPSTAKLPIRLPCAKVSARMRRAERVRYSFVSATRACP
jgi:hypothetical protein